MTTLSTQLRTALHSHIATVESLSAVARACGINKSLLSLWLRERKRLGQDNLDALAAHLGLEVKRKR